MRFTSTAETELKEATAFYQNAREGLGAEFLEVEAVIRLIEIFPSAWSSLSPQPGVAALIGFRMVCSIKCAPMKF